MNHQHGLASETLYWIQSLPWSRYWNLASGEAPRVSFEVPWRWGGCRLTMNSVSSKRSGALVHVKRGSKSSIPAVLLLEHPHKGFAAHTSPSLRKSHPVMDQELLLLRAGYQSIDGFRYVKPHLPPSLMAQHIVVWNLVLRFLRDDLLEGIVRDGTYSSTSQRILLQYVCHRQTCVSCHRTIPLLRSVDLQRIALLHVGGWWFAIKFGESCTTTVSVDSTCTVVNLATGGMISSLGNSGPNGPRKDTALPISYCISSRHIWCRYRDVGIKLVTKY